MFRVVFALVVLLAGSGCARRTIIPDDELAQIFRDAFLVNSYVSNRMPSLDSANVYEPVFARYGYTAADVRHTVGNFSRRKSARLSDVVERAIALLEEEGKYYNREVAILDTIDRVAERTFTRTVLYDSLIRVRSLRDTAHARFSLAVSPGEYKVRARYLVDSLDRNQGSLRGSVYLVKRDSSRSNAFHFTLRRGREDEFTRSLHVDTTHCRMQIDLLTFTRQAKQPSVTFRDLRVTRTLPTAEAVDSLYRKQLDIRIFTDEFIRSLAPADSL